MVPNKTIYVSDGDLPLYQRAQELAGDNLSAAITAALRRYVDVEEGRQEGFDEIIVRVGPGKGRKVRFTGVLLGEWLHYDVTAASRRFRVYRGRKGKFVLHIERSPDFTVVDDEGKPAGWRGYLGIGDISYGSAPSRGDPRGRRVARGASRPDPAPALRHGRRPGPAARRGRPRHLSRRRTGRPPGRCGMTAIGCPGRDPRDRAAQVVRQAGRPRRHRSRGRRRHGLRPPRANGAGKTTAVQILSTLIPADGGEVRVAGHDVAREPDAVRAVIGVTGQFSAVDKLFTGEENLQLMADLRHLDKAEGRRRVDELLQRFDLVEAAKKPVATYSGGMTPASRPRDDPHRPPADHLPRRADGGPRSSQPPSHVADRPRSRRRRRDDLPDDTGSRRGRPARASDRRPRPRGPGRGGDARTS